MIEAYQALAACSVMIDCDGGSGSGTVLKHADGGSLVLTCAHVVNGETSIEVIVRRDRRYRPFKATVVHVADKCDLALLRTEFLDTKTIVIGTTNPLEYQTLYAIGSPNGMNGMPLEFIMGPQVQRGAWILSGTGDGGISGAALAESDGEMIGVLDGGWHNKATNKPLGATTAIPLAAVRKHLRLWGML